MRFLLAATAVLSLSLPAAAQSYDYGTGSNSSDHYTSGYTNSRGTYVQPHYQTNPNNSQSDNYGARGNYNPHTGGYGRGY